MSGASLARGGTGKVSKGALARAGTIRKMVTEPSDQPSVPSNIPGAGPQGVPPVEAGDEAAFTREGNVEMRQTAVEVARGMTQYGPAVASSVARTGGQVNLSPGQIGAWANPIQ